MKFVRRNLRMAPKTQEMRMPNIRRLVNSTIRGSVDSFNGGRYFYFSPVVHGNVGRPNFVAGQVYGVYGVVVAGIPSEVLILPYL